MADHDTSGVAQRFVQAALNGLQRRVRYLPESAPGGWQILRYHRQYETMARVCAVAFLAMMVMCWVGDIPTGIRLFGTATFGVMLALTLLLLRICRRCTVSYSDLGIEYVPLFAKPFAFGWEDISQLEVSANEQSCVVRVADGRKARLSSMMNGYGKFLDDAPRRIGRMA